MRQKQDLFVSEIKTALVGKKFEVETQLLDPGCGLFKVYGGLKVSPEQPMVTLKPGDIHSLGRQMPVELSTALASI